VNLRTQLQRTIKRAGVAPWPKLWQKLRATRATDFARVFPGHVASGFLGHLERAVTKQDWQVTAEDFTKRGVDHVATDPRWAELGAADAILGELITLWPQLAASVREALLQQATQSLTRGP
jgi:hypothetical protein